jgi:hypothetical protein
MNDGFLLHINDEGTLCLDQLVKGQGAYALEPNAEDQHRALGFYDTDWKLIDGFDSQRR